MRTIRATREKGEFRVRNLPHLFILESEDLLFPGFLHLCEAKNIETLKSVSAMHWVAEQGIIICSCIAHELRGVV
jgi:hypothetical protein